MTTISSLPQQGQPPTGASDLERAVVAACERFRAIYGFRSAEAYGAYVNEFLRIVSEISEIEPADIERTATAIIDSGEKRPLPAEIRQKLIDGMTLRAAEKRAKTSPQPPSDDDQVFLMICYLTDTQTRGNLFLNVLVNGAGYVTREGFEGVIAQLSEKAEKRLTNIIKAAKSNAKLTAGYDYDLRFSLKTMRARTEELLGNYRRIREGIRANVAL